MVEGLKRGLPDGEAEASDAKKARINGTDVAAAPSKMDALSKARELLAKKSKVMEQLKQLKQLKQPQAAPVGAQPAAAANASILAAAAQKAAQIAAGLTATTVASGLGAAAHLAPRPFQPAPLRLDAQGREIDEMGNLIQQPVVPVTSLKVNQHFQASAAAAAAHSAHLAALSTLHGVAPTPESDPFFDPAMGAKGLKKLERRKRDFSWVQEGEFAKQAEMARLRAKYGEAAFKKVMGPKKIGPADDPNKIPLDPNKLPLGQKAAPAAALEEDEAEEALPEVEWWDKRVLASGSYEKDVSSGGQVALKLQRITNLVEHPVPIEPPAEAAPPPPQPMKLTQRELKKLRTQRRVQKEKDKQELIRQGLLEPPKPKVKVSNIARVLGAESAADPTAIEQEVRRQMAERQQAHDDRNLARKLTPAEKRDKKVKKLFDDSELEVCSAVYRVTDLSHKLCRHKVKLNAFQNNMTGVAVCTPSLSVVVVEGCAKSIKRFDKLMLRRMDWNPSLETLEDDKPVNQCHLVWHGTLKEKLFKNFSLKDCSSDADAKSALAEVSAGHYWDTARDFNPEDAPHIQI